MKYFTWYLLFHGKVLFPCKQECLQKGWDSVASFFSNGLRLLLFLWWDWGGIRDVSKTQHGAVLGVFPISVLVSFAFSIVNSFTKVFDLTDRFVYSHFLILKTL